jgi:hypothetical protein
MRICHTLKSILHILVLLNRLFKVFKWIDDRLEKLYITTRIGCFAECLSTRQNLKNTRQRVYRVLHSAKRARQTVHRQRLL